MLVPPRGKTNDENVLRYNMCDLSHRGHFLRRGPVMIHQRPYDGDGFPRPGEPRESTTRNKESGGDHVSDSYARAVRWISDRAKAEFTDADIEALLDKHDGRVGVVMNLVLSEACRARDIKRVMVHGGVGEKDALAALVEEGWDASEAISSLAKE